MSTRAAKNESQKKGKATKAKVTKKVTKKDMENSESIETEEPVILKTTPTEDGDENTVLQEEVIDSNMVAVVAAKPKAASAVQNHWSAEAETQLSEQIAHHRQQGYSGPMLWELVSSKCDYNFTADQCMSKFYREKTKERYKAQGKKRKESSEPSGTIKWTAEDGVRLSATVDQYKGTELEGSKLWSQVAESLGSKWSASQCMNKYYRDRHKQQKLNK
mgnify:CR=1 FL=1